MFKAGLHEPEIPLVEVVGKADKVAPEQIGATAAKVGVTKGFTTTVVVLVNAVLHVPNVILDKVMAWLAVAPVTVTVPLPAALNTTVAFAPPLMLYVTVALAVPVIVNTAFAPEQIGVLLVNAVTVGEETIVIHS